MTSNSTNTFTVSNSSEKSSSFTVDSRRNESSQNLDELVDNSFSESSLKNFSEPPKIEPTGSSKNSNKGNDETSEYDDDKVIKYYKK